MTSILSTISAIVVDLLSTVTGGGKSLAINKLDIYISTLIPTGLACFFCFNNLFTHY